MTQERIRRLKGKALIKLKHPSSSRMRRSFWIVEDKSATTWITQYYRITELRPRENMLFA
jgi:hypothetical protein